MTRVVLLGLALLAVAAPALLADCPVGGFPSVSPFLATASDELGFTVHGHVNRSFIPRLASVNRQGAFLTIELEADPAQFMNRIRSFELHVPIGRLPIGIYQVDLTYPEFPDCVFDPLIFEILSPAFSLSFEPPALRPGERVVVTAGGIARCAALGTPLVDDTTISLPITLDLCEHRERIELKTLLPELAEGIYNVQLVRSTGAEILVERQLPVAETTDLRLGSAGRFRVRAAFTTRASAGQGQAVTITRDSGQFWFFHPDNIELTVKLIDACRPPFGRFWVFAAGMTDVGVELTVEDLATGEIKTYENGLGTPFIPILDTSAFAGCPG